MSACDVCDGTGLWPFVDTANPKPDAEITAADLLFALCLCLAGHGLRCTTNGGKDTGYALWQLWCARNRVEPSRVCRLEDVLTGEQLASVGFAAIVVDAVERESLEARLLAAGRTPRKVKL